MTGSVWHVAMATLAFVGSHFVLSSPPLRGPLVARLGERPFLALYSLLAVALIVWTAAAYNDAPFVEVWTPPTGLRHLSLGVMPFACILVVAGLTTANPSAVGTDGRAVAARGPRGILRVTRHPVMWGFGLWGISHLLANGDAAGIILFGGMTILALAGARAIDAKKSLGDEPSWKAFCDQTSFWPFAAVLSGRTRLGLAEIGWWRPALGIALYVGLLATHPWLFGVDPWPL
ncbi:MAG: NnrU family protein [Rhodospirillales bacterium]